MKLIILCFKDILSGGRGWWHDGRSISIDLPNYCELTVKIHLSVILDEYLAIQIENWRHNRLDKIIRTW